MDFGEALKALKEGKKVSRSSWNGKNQFIYLVPSNEYQSQTVSAKEYFGDTVSYRAYLAIKTVQETVVPWVASQSDLLEEDWEVV